MSPGQNGWEDEPEEEREAWKGDDEPLGTLDPYEGWPEELAGCEYWLYKREIDEG